VEGPDVVREADAGLAVWVSFAQLWNFGDSGADCVYFQNFDTNPETEKQAVKPLVGISGTHRRITYATETVVVGSGATMVGNAGSERRKRTAKV
jgi:hypothetical protein